MKPIIFLLVCAMLLGCLHTSGAARAERELRIALLEAFQQENNIPSERDIRELKDHSWSLELTLRSVHLENNMKRISPLLRLFRRQHAKSDFVARVQRMVEDVGCSKALLCAALESSNDVDFDFYETESGELNPRYRYSQTVFDERAIFPRRLPFRPQLNANSR